MWAAAASRVWCGLTRSGRTYIYCFGRDGIPSLRAIEETGLLPWNYLLWSMCDSFGKRDPTQEVAYKGSSLDFLDSFLWIQPSWLGKKARLRPTRQRHVVDNLVPWLPIPYHIPQCLKHSTMQSTATGRVMRHSARHRRPMQALDFCCIGALDHDSKILSTSRAGGNVAITS